MAIDNFKRTAVRLINTSVLFKGPYLTLQEENFKGIHCSSFGHTTSRMGLSNTRFTASMLETALEMASGSTCSMDY